MASTRPEGLPVSGGDHRAKVSSAARCYCSVNRRPIISAVCRSLLATNARSCAACYVAQPPDAEITRRASVRRGRTIIIAMKGRWGSTRALVAAGAPNGGTPPRGFIRLRP